MLVGFCDFACCDSFDWLVACGFRRFPYMLFCVMWVYVVYIIKCLNWILWEVFCLLVMTFYLVLMSWFVLRLMNYFALEWICLLFGLFKCLTVWFYWCCSGCSLQVILLFCVILMSCVCTLWFCFCLLLLLWHWCWVSLY